MRTALTLFGWLLVSAVVSGIITLIVAGVVKLFRARLSPVVRWVMFGVLSLAGWFVVVPLFIYLVLG